MQRSPMKSRQKPMPKGRPLRRGSTLKQTSSLKPGKPLARKKWLRASVGGAQFPARRNPAYRRFVRGEPCLLMTRLTATQMCPYDRSAGPLFRGWWIHVCWGPIDPAHVGDHQARGAPDIGAIAPLCRGAHRFYDERRSAWAEVTGISDAEMASVASGLALKWAETGGTP